MPVSMPSLHPRSPTVRGVPANNSTVTRYCRKDVTKPGGDRLVDAVVAYGSAEGIAQRLRQHVAAGADHVAVQVVESDRLLPVLTALAAPLGLDSQAPPAGR
ncbi:hypothetical protein [Mycolicibacterium hodleri]